MTPLQRLYSESYAVEEMHKQRRAAIAAASSARCVGLLFSSLGRQGSVGVFEDLLALLNKRGVAAVPVLMSEFAPRKLDPFKTVDAFVQVRPLSARPSLARQVGVASRVRISSASLREPATRLSRLAALACQSTGARPTRSPSSLRTRRTWLLASSRT